MGAKCRSKVLQNAPCNTSDLHYAIIGLEKQNNFLSFFEWPLKTGFFSIQLSLMGIQFEKFKKKSYLPTHTGKTGSGKGKQKYFSGWPKLI